MRLKESSFLNILKKLLNILIVRLPDVYTANYYSRHRNLNIVNRIIHGLEITYKTIELTIYVIVQVYANYLQTLTFK